MHPDWLSNTYLVAAGPGGDGFLVDAGGPVRPLLERGRRARHRPSPTCCSPIITTTTSPSWARSRAAGRTPQVLIHPDERDLVDGATGDLEPGDELEHRRADRARPSTRPATRAACSRCWSTAREVFTGDTLFRNSVGGVRAPGHTTYADLKRSIMDVLLAAAARDDDPPRPHGPDDGRRGAARATRSCASGAGSIPRATSRAPRWASRPRWCCSATTTTAATRRGCAGPTAPTTSCRGRRSSAGGSLAWRGVSGQQRTSGLSVKTLLIAGAASAVGGARDPAAVAAGHAVRRRDDADHRRAGLRGVTSPVEKVSAVTRARVAAHAPAGARPRGDVRPAGAAAAEELEPLPEARRRRAPSSAPQAHRASVEARARDRPDRLRGAPRACSRRPSCSSATRSRAAASGPRLQRFGGNSHKPATHVGREGQAEGRAARRRRSADADPGGRRRRRRPPRRRHRPPTPRAGRHAAAARRRGRAGRRPRRPAP